MSDKAETESEIKKRTIQTVINELQQKKEQLKALIIFLKNSGANNPQYHQLQNCIEEYNLVNSQINEFQEILKRL